MTADDAGPVEFVYKMPAATTFDRFAIPDVLEWPGNVTFIKNVVVPGSLEGPDSGYQVLATFELESHDEAGQVTEVIPDVMTPVRWVKVMFDGGINIEPGDEGNTALRFSELIGNGTQEPQPPSTRRDQLQPGRTGEVVPTDGRPPQLRNPPPSPGRWGREHVRDADRRSRAHSRAPLFRQGWWWGMAKHVPSAMRRGGEVGTDEPTPTV